MKKKASPTSISNCTKCTWHNCDNNDGKDDDDDDDDNSTTTTTTTTTNNNNNNSNNNNWEQGRSRSHNRVPRFTPSTSYVIHTLSLPTVDMI